MNSWKSTLLSACAPPFSTFIIGTGQHVRRLAAEVAPERQAPSAAARLRGRERDAEDRVRSEPALVGVPSSSIIARSSASWSAASRPVHGLGDLAVHVRDRLGDALAGPGVAAVAQLDGLELAGRGAGRAPRRGRRRRTSARRRPRRWGCRGCRGSAGRGPARSRSCSASTCCLSRRPPAQRELGVDIARPSTAAYRRRQNSSARRSSSSCAGARAARLHAAPSRVQRRRAGSPGSSPKISPPRSSSRLISFQLRTTSPAVSAARSPNTCGWRRISFSRQCSATSARLPCAALLEQQRQEVDLEQHVAELVEQLRVVARVGGVGELVGLLDRVRHDRALVLLAVPGALAPQPAGDLVEAASERGRRASALGPLRAAAAGVAAALRLRGLPAALPCGLLRPAGAPPGLPAGEPRDPVVGLVLRSVLALDDAVVVRAVRLVLVVLAEVLDELVERLLLALRAQQVLDRLLRLLERLLRGLGDLRRPRRRTSRTAS